MRARETIEWVSEEREELRLVAEADRSAMRYLAARARASVLEPRMLVDNIVRMRSETPPSAVRRNSRNPVTGNGASAPGCHDS